MLQLQSKSARNQRATAPTPRACSGQNRMAALSLSLFALPLADAPMPVDDGLVGVLIAACLVGGFAIGMLYRSMTTKEEQITKRMEIAEAELRTLLTMTDDAVLVLNAKGIVRNANPAAEEIFGRGTEEIIGSELVELLPQPMQLSALTRNGPAQFETSAKRKGGTIAHVEVLLSHIHHTDQNGYLVLIHEYHEGGFGHTEEPSNHLSAPVSNFCHDLNNHLTGVIGNLSLILMKSATEPSLREHVLSAKRTALKAQEISMKMHRLATGESEETETDAAQVPPPVLPLSEISVPAGGRILILDDEEAICSLVCAALDSMGYQVTEALDVGTAVNACEAALKAGKPFDLVISDLSLSGEMNGTAAVARLKQIDPNLKAILSSGYDNDPIMNRFREHGFCAAISKPYEIAQLGRIVREAIGEDPERKSA